MAEKKNRNLIISNPSFDLHIACSKHTSNTMQETHAVCGELAHRGSEPFIYKATISPHLSLLQRVSY